MSDQIGARLLRAKKGDQRAIAELLSWVERTGPEALREAEILKPQSRAFRIGITGPPGAGKSTLVGQLIGEFRRAGLRLGILAVDPSSPFSHGAILGDRIRYSDHAMDPGVFIRSIGTRGSLGGLSASAYLMLRVFDASGFDVVLIETVGVGQTELEVMNVADQIVVVLVPESGDSVQAMKAGLLEIADWYVVNKSDRPGADSLAKELLFISEMAPSDRRKPQVLSTIATNGTGVAELAEKLIAAKSTPQQSAERLRQEALALLRQKFDLMAKAKVKGIRRPEDLPKVLGVSIKARRPKPRAKK